MIFSQLGWPSETGNGNLLCISRKGKSGKVGGDRTSWNAGLRVAGAGLGKSRQVAGDGESWCRCMARYV